MSFSTYDARRFIINCKKDVRPSLPHTKINSKRVTDTYAKTAEHLGKKRKHKLLGKQFKGLSRGTHRCMATRDLDKTRNFCTIFFLNHHCAIEVWLS